MRRMIAPGIIVILAVLSRPSYGVDVMVGADYAPPQKHRHKIPKVIGKSECRALLALGVAPGEEVPASIKVACDGDDDAERLLLLRKELADNFVLGNIAIGAYNQTLPIEYALRLGLDHLDSDESRVVDIIGDIGRGWSPNLAELDPARARVSKFLEERRNAIAKVNAAEKCSNPDTADESCREKPPELVTRESSTNRTRRDLAIGAFAALIIGIIVGRWSKRDDSKTNA